MPAPFGGVRPGVPGVPVRRACVEQGVEIAEVPVDSEAGDAGFVRDGRDRGVCGPDRGVEADRGLRDALARLVDLLGTAAHAIRS
jgi:hypothetical protein